MFRKFGYKAGLLSTVCNYIDGEAIPADHTTPDPIELNELLAKMVDAGCEYAFMECSSHAIHQHRIGGLRYVGGIFTNLTRDHLDYHKTFENYRNAKKMFFDGLPKEAFAITNADDKNGMIMVQNTKAEVKTYSTQRAADFTAKILEEHFDGMLLEIDGKDVFVQFIGRFNVSNLLAVYGAAVMLGKKPEDILVVLSTLKSVNGRLEPIGFARRLYRHCRLCAHSRCFGECAQGHPRCARCQGRTRHHGVWRRWSPRQGKAPTHGPRGCETER